MKKKYFQHLQPRFSFAKCNRQQCAMICNLCNTMYSHNTSNAETEKPAYIHSLSIDGAFPDVHASPAMCTNVHRSSQMLDFELCVNKKPSTLSHEGHFSFCLTV